MAKLSKVFQSFKGLDLRTSDILRTDNAATSLNNMTYRQTGAMSKRKGFQFTTDSGKGGYGLFTFNNVNIDSGAVTEEVLSVDDNLQSLVTHSFTITYTGAANSNTYYTLFLDTNTSTFKFKLYDNGDIVLDSDLGDGTDGADATVNDLTTAINAETNFTCTSASGGTSEPAAFIPVSARTDINTTANVSFEIWEQVSTPSGLSNPFSNFYAQRTDSNFENATFAQINDVTYISTGHDNLMKYDGNRVYRAGMPQHPDLVVADSSSGTAFGIGEVHSYLAVYEYIDAKQNSVQGLVSNINTHTQVANKDIDITITYLTDSDFNIDQATVNGNQAGVNTITVISSANLKVGDFVYINDGVSGDVVSRKITAIPDGTSITVEGNAVNVTDTEIISNVKISLYRTEDHQATPNAPTLFYLVYEEPNDSSGTTVVITDNVDDVTLTGNAQWIDPIIPHGLPPKGKYIDDWRGLLIISGSLTNVNTVYYSDVDSPEYFAPFGNDFRVDRKVTGLKSLDNVLYVFKAKSIDGVTGDLTEGATGFQVDPVSREGVGCAAHATIQEVQGRLFFLSSRGVYAINNEGLVDVGSPIEPRFEITSPFEFKQAVGFIWQADKKYVLFMPDSPTNSNDSDDATSEVYAYDYFRKAWLQWSNFNMMGGMTEKDGQIYKVTRDVDTFNTTRLHKLLQNQNEYDYADHATAISFSYKSPWFTEGEPSIWKKYLRCKIHSYDTSVNDFENDTFTITLKTEHDYNPARTWTNITYDFSGGALGWGAGPWGEFPWGDIRLPQLKKKLASKKVRSLRVILENSIVYENVLVSGLEFEVATPYAASLKE